MPRAAALATGQLHTPLAAAMSHTRMEQSSGALNRLRALELWTQEPLKSVKGNCSYRLRPTEGGPPSARS